MIDSTADQELKSYYSDLYLSKTWRKFFEDIDRAAEAEGFMGEKRRELENQIKQRGTMTQVNETILPIYIRLRAMGYNHQELIA